MFKFEIGQTVYKTKGYTFIGKVVSRYTVEGGNRYDVQVDTWAAQQYLEDVCNQYKVASSQLEHLDEMMGNCNGMIHIFAEEQLEEYIYDD